MKLTRRPRRNRAEIESDLSTKDGAVRWLVQTIRTLFDLDYDPEDMMLTYYNTISELIVEGSKTRPKVRPKPRFVAAMVLKEFVNIEARLPDAWTADWNKFLSELGGGQNNKPKPKPKTRSKRNLNRKTVEDWDASFSSGALESLVESISKNIAQAVVYGDSGDWCDCGEDDCEECGEASAEDSGSQAPKPEAKPEAKPEDKPKSALYTSDAEWEELRHANVPYYHEPTNPAVQAWAVEHGYKWDTEFAVYFDRNGKQPPGRPESEILDDPEDNTDGEQ
jgi:hypothetical protein